MKFSCWKCGRAYVASDKVRGRGFKMTCRGCGAVIVVTLAADGTAKQGVQPSPPDAPGTASSPRGGEQRREEAKGSVPHAEAQAAGAAGAPPRGDPFAVPADDPFAVPASNPFAVPASNPFAAPPRDPFAPPAAGERPAPPLPGLDEQPAPARDAANSTGTDAGVPSRGEAEAAFAALAREMEGTGEPPLESGFRTGEQPLVPGEGGEIAPASASSPAAAIQAGAVEDAPAPVPARSAPRRRRPVLVPLLAVGALGAGALGVLQLRSGDPSAQARARGERSSASSGVAGGGPPSDLGPAAPAPRELATPSPPVPASPSLSVEAPAPPAVAPPVPPASEPRRGGQASRAQTAEPRGQAKRKPLRAPPAPKSAGREPVVAAAPAVPEARKPPADPERPLVAVAPRPAPGPAQPPDEDAPAAESGTEQIPPLDDAQVEAAFAGSMKRFEACMAAARAGEPSVALGGRTVTLTVTVNPSGKALYPTLDDAELSATELGKCLKRETAKIQFPAFGGEPIRVRRPITLK